MKASSIYNIFLYLCLGALLYFLFAQFTRTPCDRTITYSIGSIDPAFNLHRSDVEQYVAQAASLWNNAAQKELFAAKSTGNITINFVFDNRQRNTIQRQQMTEHINIQKENLDTIKGSFASLKSEYQNKVAAFEQAQHSFQMRLDSYNQTVTYWNSRGGADANTVRELAEQKIALGNEQDRLNSEINQIRALEFRLNNYTDEHNAIVRNVNNTVSTLNQGAGEEFQEGVYDPATRTITIYQYQTLTDLKRVLAHELGHTLQINHVDDKNAIMYYLNTHGELRLSITDKQALNTMCRL